MLKLAQALCAQVIPASADVAATIDGYFFQHGTLNWTENTALIDTNADAETWLKLCSLGNRPIVRVPYVDNWANIGTKTAPVINPVTSLYWGDSYPAGAAVLDDHGHVVNGITPDNFFPVCFQKPTDAAQLALATSYLAAHPVGGEGGAVIPFCPDVLFQDPANQLASTPDLSTGLTTYTDADKWAIRGAINAGMSVFMYVDQLEKGNVAPKPQFNHCEQLVPAASP